MDQFILDKNFLQGYPVAEETAQNIAYTMITEWKRFQKDMDKERKKLSQEELESILAEEKLVAQAEDGESIANLFRKRLSGAGICTLMEKARAHESEVAPHLLKRLCSSHQNEFVEIAATFFGTTETNYSESLLQIYGEIPYEYTRSLFCVVLGLRGDQSMIQKMFEEYERMADEMDSRGENDPYSEETFEEGPLIALHVLYRRFCEKKKRK